MSHYLILLFISCVEVITDTHIHTHRKIHTAIVKAHLHMCA